MTQKTNNVHVHHSGRMTSPKQKQNVNQQHQPKKEEKNGISSLIHGKTLPILSVVLFVLFVGYQLLVENSSVLWKLQERSLFITDLTYLKECLSWVGGLSVYVATFFNGFFYYPWLGTIIYISFLLLVTWMTSKAFNLKSWLFPLALIPSLLLLLMLTQNGYMIYWIKLNAFSYVSIMGVLVTIMGVILGKTTRKPITQSLVVALYMLVAYPIAGVYATMGSLLFAVISVKQAIGEKKFTHLIPAGVALLSLLLVPLAYDEWVFQASNKYYYLSNLPEYWNTESKRMLWLPYQLGAVCLLLFTIFLPIKPTDKKRFRLVPFFLFIATAFLVVSMTCKNGNYKTELSMMEASEKGDWDQVLRLAKKERDEPTRLIIMYTDMALYKLNKLGDEKYYYNDGDKKKEDTRVVNDPDNEMNSQIAGSFFFFNYGKINACHRWCMENSVEYGMSATNLKYFVLSNAVNGQKALARKYNNILAKSLFYRPLAGKLAKIIEDPSLLDKDPTYSKVLVLTKYGNMLESAYTNMEKYFLYNFAYTAGGPPEMVELCLMANMELKNLNQFWPAYFAYTELYKKSIPIHVQEAALLFNQLQKTHYVNPDLYDPAVIQRFNQFLTLVEQYSGLSESAASKMFKPSFGNTYWYRFYFRDSQPAPDLSHKSSPYSS